MKSIDISTGDPIKDKLWDALSDILEDPGVVLPKRLRKSALKAISQAQAEYWLSSKFHVLDLKQPRRG